MLADGDNLVELAINSFETDELQRIFDLELVGTRLVTNLRQIVVKTRKPEHTSIKFMRIEVISTLTHHLLGFTSVLPTKLGIEESFEFGLQEAKKLGLYSGDN